jgi:transposase
LDPETGPTSTWLWHELKAADAPVICIDARHAQALPSVLTNKTDGNDARGIAEMMCANWFHEVKVKERNARRDGALIASRTLIVRQPCELENQVRGLMKNFGLRCKVTRRATGAGSRSGHEVQATHALQSDLPAPHDNAGRWRPDRFGLFCSDRRSTDVNRTP